MPLDVALATDSAPTIVQSRPFTRKLGEPIAEDLASYARDLIRRLGLPEAARVLGDVPASTLAYAAAGCGLRRLNHSDLTARLRAAQASGR